MRPRLLHLGYQEVKRMATRNQNGFNEAEAFTPRIRVNWMIKANLLILASMRPRLLHLGYVILADLPTGDELGLQ